MSTIASGTRFIGISTNVNLTERRSSLINNESEPFTIEDISTSSVADGISANGFTVIGAINANITLPQNSVVNYTGPLTMGGGYTLIVPSGTTLNIVQLIKKIIEKAKQYESKKSLDGKMKFLKGNVGKVVKDSVNKKTKNEKI